MRRPVPIDAGLIRDQPDPLVLQSREFLLLQNVEPRQHAMIRRDHAADAGRLHRLVVANHAHAGRVRADRRGRDGRDTRTQRRQTLSRLRMHEIGQQNHIGLVFGSIQIEVPVNPVCP